MIEIELKFANADFEGLESELKSMGATPEPGQLETDHYFNAPDRDFARTDEAFRLRRAGTANTLTYKGPKRATAVKSRPEIEVALENGDHAANACVSLLQHLGYRGVAVVRKQRKPFRLVHHGFPLAVCLDELLGVGRFAEVETVVPEDQIEEANRVVMEVADLLQLKQVERRSYLNLYLSWRERQLG